MTKTKILTALLLIAIGATFSLLGYKQNIEYKDMKSSEVYPTVTPVVPTNDIGIDTSREIYVQYESELGV